MKNKPNIYDAVVSLVGEQSGSSDADTFENTIYNDGQTPPSKSAAEAELAKLIKAFDENEVAQEYARNRAAEYPSQGDQNDMIYKDMLNSTTTHKDAVEAVKTKWPKNNTGPVE
jgi:hypothetical protein